MDIACYQSVGVNTAMLYNGTTLNKALLLDWPVTLCVHLMDFCSHTIFSVGISQKTWLEFLKKHEAEFVIPSTRDSACLSLFFCNMFWLRPVCAPSNSGMLQDTTVQGKGDKRKRVVTDLELRLRLSSVAARFPSVAFPVRCNVLQHPNFGSHSLYMHCETDAN